MHRGFGTAKSGMDRAKAGNAKRAVSAKFCSWLAIMNIKDHAHINPIMKEGLPMKKLLHCIIGLILLAAVMIVIRGCLPGRKKTDRSRVSRQNSAYELAGPQPEARPEPAAA